LSDTFYKVTFSSVTLIRKLQSTSDLDHFHAHDLRCSHVKSRDDPISDCRVDSNVPYSFIYIDYPGEAVLALLATASCIYLSVTVSLTCGYLSVINLWPPVSHTFTLVNC